MPKIKQPDGSWSSFFWGMEEFTGATADEAGTNGVVPAPAAGDQNKFLKGDGSWGTATGASITVDSALSDTSTNPVQNKVIKTELDKKVPQESNATIELKSINNGDVGVIGVQPGAAKILVQESGSRSVLVMTSGGKLSFNGNSVVRSVNNTVADDSGNVDLTAVSGVPSYAVCSTALNTPAKVATVTRGSFSKVDGALVVVKFNNAGRQQYFTAPTLNVNSTGAYEIAPKGMLYYIIPSVDLFMYISSHYYVVQKGNIQSTYSDYSGDGG